MNTIAIDCGSSFIKAALFDSEGKIIQSISKRSPKVDLKQEITDTTHIEILSSMVKEIYQTLIDKSDEEVKVSVSNEMHGFLLTDENGKPITDYISWQHELGDENGKAILSEERYKQEIINSGMPLRMGLPSVNLLQLKRKGLMKNYKLMKFYTLGDYVTRILTDREPISHMTNAASTGLTDLRMNQWNEKLLNLVTENVIFPEIGNSTIELMTGERLIKFYPALGDQQAALYGAGLSDESELSFNIGTGGQVSKILNEIKFSSEYQVRPFLNGKYIKTIPHLPSGRAFNVYIRFIEDILKQFEVKVTEQEIWEKLLTAENQSVESDLIVDLSFFENSVSKNVKGSIENIGEYSLTIGNLMKAVINQIADNFINIALKIESDKNKVKKIIFSGGISQRIESIRERILRSYDCEDYEVAQSDTLYGLFKYTNS